VTRKAPHDAYLPLRRRTDEIHDEWIGSVLSDRPDIKPESLRRCRALMDRHVPDSLVEGYEGLIPG
jgi:hypothetical protein